MPKLVECQICGSYHPSDFTGDCRDDLNRFATPDDPFEDEAWQFDDEEPCEGDLITSDHVHYYEKGSEHRGPVLTIENPAFDVEEIRTFMDVQQYWPDAWFISDHGNAHKITLDI